MENREPMVAANDVIGWSLVITCERLLQIRKRVCVCVQSLGAPHANQKPLRFPRTCYFFFQVKLLPVYGVCFGLESM
jgi:hypothetical protein